MGAGKLGRGTTSRSAWRRRRRRRRRTVSGSGRDVIGRSRWTDDDAAAGRRVRVVTVDDVIPLPSNSTSGRQRRHSSPGESLPRQRQYSGRRRAGNSISTLIEMYAVSPPPNVYIRCVPKRTPDIIDCNVKRGYQILIVFLVWIILTQLAVKLIMAAMFFDVFSVYFNGCFACSVFPMHA